MKLEDTPPNKRPNLHHTHSGKTAVAAGTTHTHDITDHYGRDFETIEHTHDADGNITVGGARHKLPKQTFV